MAIKKTEKELIARDLKRDVWQETLDAIRSIKANWSAATNACANRSAATQKISAHGHR